MAYWHIDLYAYANLIVRLLMSMKKNDKKKKKKKISSWLELLECIEYTNSGVSSESHVL